MATFVVTGANRGFGEEFVTQILLHKPDARVVATARDTDKAASLHAMAKTHPGRLTLVQLDLEDEASIEAGAAAIAHAHPEGIDVLINNAGYGDMDSRPHNTTAEEFLKVFRTNVVGTHLVTQALLPLLRTGRADGALKKIANIGSAGGSISLQAQFLELGGTEFTRAYAGFETFSFAYRVSKAAESMVGVFTAKQLQAEGIAVLTLHPGWAPTDMGTAGAVSIGNGASPPQTIPEGVAGSLKVIDELTLEQTGQFKGFDGSDLPW